jgi:hypothetical protein
LLRFAECGDFHAGVRVHYNDVMGRAVCACRP